MRDPDAAIRLLGLATRAGAVVPGTAQVRQAVRAGRIRFVVVAADASANSREKLLPLLAARRVRFVVAFDREALGRAVGRAPLSAAGTTDQRFAARVAELLSAPEAGAGDGQANGGGWAE